jgi:hypothetical protein
MATPYNDKILIQWPGGAKKLGKGATIFVSVAGTNLAGDSDKDWSLTSRKQPVTVQKSLFNGIGYSMFRLHSSSQ